MQTGAGRGRVGRPFPAALVEIDEVNRLDHAESNRPLEATGEKPPLMGEKNPDGWWVSVPRSGAPRSGQVFVRR